MPIVYACICPPTGPHAGRTAEALECVAEELAGYRPETALLVASAKSPREKIAVFVGRRLSDHASDVELAERIMDEAAADTIPVDAIRRWDGDCPISLDPAGVRIAAVVAGRLEPRFHFQLGRAAARAVESLDRNIVVICSVELASVAGTRFDAHYRRAIASWDVKALVHMDAQFRRQADENAVAQTAVLMGALSGYRIQPRELSYEPADPAGQLAAAIDVLGPRRLGR